PLDHRRIGQRELARRGRHDAVLRGGRQEAEHEQRNDWKELAQRHGKSPKNPSERIERRPRQLKGGAASYPPLRGAGRQARRLLPALPEGERDGVRGLCDSRWSEIPHLARFPRHPLPWGGEGKKRQSIAGTVRT